MSKRTLSLAVAVAFGLSLGLPLAAQAEVNNPQHLNNRGQSKVNNVKAKRWTQEGKKDGYSSMQDQTIVNFGSKKAGTCNMNVGAPAPGQKAPKEVVVTAKDIINICK